MLINLTPHAMHLYAPDCPEQIDPADHEPILTIGASGDLARMTGDELGTWYLDGIPVASIDYRGVTGMPEYAGHMDSRDREVWYLVSLPTALAVASVRGDVLVPYLHVRNAAGQVIGCRMFARPV